MSQEVLKFSTIDPKSFWPQTPSLNQASNYKRSKTKAIWLLQVNHNKIQDVAHMNLWNLHRILTSNYASFP
jgi:hypothetical protein